MAHGQTQREIQIQTAAWRDAQRAVAEQSAALIHLWQNTPPDSIIVTGCGSTHYLSMITAYLLQVHTGIPARAFPASELIFHPEAAYFGKRPLLIAITRSATTSETVHAVSQFRESGRGDIVVITCYGDKPLNQLASINIVAEGAQEDGIAQTQSFSAMLIMAESVARLWGGAQPIGAFSTEYDSMVNKLSEIAFAYADPDRFQRVFFLGSGELYGMACEGMLKMKEMSLTSAEAFHPMEFRHGPKAMVDEQTLVVGLMHEHGHEVEHSVFAEMAQLGATVVTLGVNPAASVRLMSDQTPAPLVVMLPFLQWLAYHRAVRKGVDPDAPRNLDAVVVLQPGLIS